MALGTATCAPTPHGELWVLWATDKRKGKEGNYNLIKEKLDALYSQKSSSIKFPKKNLLAENKHQKNFQISVSTVSLVSVSLCLFIPFCLTFCLSLSLGFSLSLSVLLFFSFCLSLFWSLSLSVSLSLSLSLPLLLLCLFWKLRKASNVDPKAVYTEPDGSSD